LWDLQCWDATDANRAQTGRADTLKRMARRSVPINENRPRIFSGFDTSMILRWLVRHPGK